MAIFKGNAQELGAALPVSVAAAGTLQTGWIDTRKAPRWRLRCKVGAGGGTPAFTYQQANTSAGGAAKALAAWGAGTYSAPLLEVENRGDQLDLLNGFYWVQVTCTITGGTGTVISLEAYGEDAILAQ
jgi:hypothetical protein